jgi:hypothetical protein
MTEEPAWISGRDLMPLIREIPNPVGIEIGVDEGPTSWYWLKNIPTLKLHGIDPFIEYVDWYPGGLRQQEGLNQRYQLAISRLEPYMDRWMHHKMTSDEAVNLFEDLSIDFIFIDGLHEYDQVLKDCYNYYPKIKSGGIFSGHDYRVVEGVGRAVDQFAAKVNKQVMYLPDNDVWYWIKD